MKTDKVEYYIIPVTTNKNLNADNHKFIYNDP